MTLRLQHQDHAHADAVLGDLAKLGCDPASRALIEALVAASACVRITLPEPLDPPNAWLRKGGEECDWSLTYDPREWPSIAHAGSPSSDLVLLSLLRGAAERLSLHESTS